MAGLEAEGRARLPAPGDLKSLARQRRAPCVADAGRADEPIATSGQGLNPTLAAGLLAKHPTQCCDLDREVALLDGEAGPRGFDQRILGDWDPRPLHQHAQHRDGTLAKRDGFGPAEQDPRLRVKTERDRGCKSWPSPDLTPLQKHLGAFSE